jgi:hypothetical protein
MLLTINLAQFDYFCDIVTPILVFVILPIVIVWLVLRHRRHELDKRTEVMLKALECGVPMDAPIFRQGLTTGASIQRRNKRKAQGTLVASIISFGIGLLPFLFGLLVTLQVNTEELTEDKTEYFAVVVLILLFGALFLIIGTVLLVIYFINRKNYERELAELDEGRDLK